MQQTAPCNVIAVLPADVRNLEDLRNFVHLALCQKENLLEHHFPVTEVELEKKGKHCGTQFILHGPRSLKLSAVWDRMASQVLLYDAIGRRFARVQLPNLAA